jgi:hypothetical protein
MQNFTLFRQILSTTVMFIMSISLSAQEVKKEVHIKVVENGVVTKDTVYNFTGESPEFEHSDFMAGHPGNMKHPRVREKHVYVMSDSVAEQFERDKGSNEQVFVFSDSTGEDFEWVEGVEKHKEVKVIVHDGKGRGPAHEVEEIWIGEPGLGRPCRTIIIHDGDCPERKMDKEVIVIVTDESGNVAPGAPAHSPKHGEKPAHIKRKVVKSDGGKKVTIIETTIETEDK